MYEGYRHTERFLSTLSLRRATAVLPRAIIAPTDFYPRSPCGERLPVFSWRCPLTYFYPRSPCGERPCCFAGSCSTTQHFYPRSPCGERLHAVHFFSFCGGISIHALLAESDVAVIVTPPAPSYFYPRSPCGERRERSARLLVQLLFLSTLSLRRATCNTHQVGVRDGISIHALLAESDLHSKYPKEYRWQFLSTLSLRRATETSSIDDLEPSNFYPRSPCGERLCLYRLSLITLPISIHALLAESDQCKL